MENKKLKELLEEAKDRKKSHQKTYEAEIDGDDAYWKGRTDEAIFWIEKLKWILSGNP